MGDYIKACESCGKAGKDNYYFEGRILCELCKERAERGRYD